MPAVSWNISFSCTSMNLYLKECVFPKLLCLPADRAAQNIVVGGTSCPSTPNKWEVPCEMPFLGCFVFSRSACLLTLVPFSFLAGFRGPQGQVSKFTSVIHCYVYTFGIFLLILKKDKNWCLGAKNNVWTPQRFVLEGQPVEGTGLIDVHSEQPLPSKYLFVWWF